MKKDKKWIVDKWTKERNETNVYDPMYQSISEFIADVNQLDESENLSIEKEQLIKRIENYIPLHDKTVGDVVDGILEIVKQLPEMEVLSPEWIYEHAKTWMSMRETERYVKVDDLQTLLVPKQEEITESFKETVRELIETSELAMDVRNLTGMTLEEIKEEARNGGFVPKQEEVKIESLWAEDIEEAKENGMTLFKTMDWMGIDSDDKEKQDLFARAWLDGYEVEEEQKYYVSVRDEEYGGFWFLSKNNNGDISIGVSRDCSEADWDRLKLTEQEIKDYDERFWPFAKPVEELEE